jgi:hypothetical protein
MPHSRGGGKMPYQNRPTIEIVETVTVNGLKAKIRRLDNPEFALQHVFLEIAINDKTICFAYSADVSTKLMANALKTGYYDILERALYITYRNSVYLMMRRNAELLIKAVKEGIDPDVAMLF